MIVLMSMLLQSAAAVAAEPTAATKPADDAKIVCKTVLPTGSRLGGTRVCLPRKEWRRLHESGEEATRDIQDNHSKQPTNQ